MDEDDGYVPQISQMEWMDHNPPGGSMSNGQPSQQHQQQSPYCSGGMNAMNYYEPNGTNALNAMQQMTNMYGPPQSQQQQQHNGPPPGYLQHQQQMMAQHQAQIRAQHQQHQQQQAPPAPAPPAKKTRQRKNKKDQAAAGGQANPPPHPSQQQPPMNQAPGYGYMGPTPPHMVHPNQAMRYPPPNSYEYSQQQQAAWQGQQYPNHMQPPGVPPNYRPLAPGQPPNGTQYASSGSYPNPQMPPQQNYYQQPQMRPPYYGHPQGAVPQPTTSQTTPAYSQGYPTQQGTARYPGPTGAPNQTPQQLPPQQGYNNYGMDPNGYYQTQQQPLNSGGGYSKQQNPVTPQPSSVPPPPGYPPTTQPPQPSSQQQPQMPSKGYGHPHNAPTNIPPGAPPYYMPPQQIQMEMMECERQMQMLLQQPRTAEIQQKIDYIQQRQMHLRRMTQPPQHPSMTPNGGGPPSAGNYPQPPSMISPRSHNQHHQLPPSQQQMQHYPQSVPKQEQKPSLSTPTPSTPISAPVSVMQTSASQVQVNITPEMSGRTLISIQHHQQYPPAATSAASTSSGYGSKDSIPPEPLPPNVQQPPSIQTTHVPPPQQFGTYQNGQQMTPPPQVPYQHKPEIAEPPKVIDKLMVGATEMVTGEENYLEEHKIERIENINRTDNVPVQHSQLEQTQPTSIPPVPTAPETEITQNKNYEEEKEQKIKEEVSTDLKETEDKPIENNNIDNNNDDEEDMDNDEQMQMEIDYNPPRAPAPAEMRDDEDEEYERPKTPESPLQQEETVQTEIKEEGEDSTAIEEQGELSMEETDVKEKTPTPEPISETTLVEVEIPKSPTPMEASPTEESITEPVLETMEVEPESVAGEPSTSISIERDFSESNEGTPGLQSIEASEPASVVEHNVDDSSFIESPERGKKKRGAPKPRVRKTPAKKMPATQGRKRRKESDPEDDDNEYSFNTKSARKQKKLAKQVAATVSTDAEMDALIEKRRSGRRKVEETSYADKQMDFEQSEEEIIGEGDNDEEEIKPWRIFDNVWVVEKILGMKKGMRPAAKKVELKEETPDKNEVEDVELSNGVEKMEKDNGEANEKIEDKQNNDEPEDKQDSDSGEDKDKKDQEKDEIKIDQEVEETEKGNEPKAKTPEPDSEAMASENEKSEEEKPKSKTPEPEVAEPQLELAEVEDKEEENPTITEKEEDVPLGTVDTGMNKTDEGELTKPSTSEGKKEEEVKMEEVDLFYVKFKHKSYRHCVWKSSAELEEHDPKVNPRLNRYRTKNEYLDDEILDTDLFNEDFLIPDRVVDMAADDDETEFCLIKWHALPYEECTWELSADIENEDIKNFYHKWNDEIDPIKIKAPARPDIDKFIPITEEKEYKNDNELREYQIEGVNWLLYCYFHQNNCILADEMGLGKTIQTITLLQGIYEAGIHGPFLVVVPLSTLHNWEKEFETWTDMNSIVYHGGAKSRELLQNSEFYYKQTMTGGKRKPVIKFDALITTFEMVVTDCEILRKFNFRVCVIDEAHRLKNRHCKLLTGGLQNFRIEHRVLLTGTPLQNNINELFSLLNFLDPDKFSCQNEFLEKFGNCQTEEQVTALQNMLKPMMLRRLKEDVEKSLQPKEETIIEVQLSNIQKKYYRAIMERNFTHLLKGNNMPSLMNIMMELRKCCNHPFLIKGAEEQIVNEYREQNPDENEYTQNHTALIQSSGKLVLIDKLLPKLEKDGHKVLIFSQMVKVLDLIEEYLVYRHYAFERIDGNVRGDLRQAAIDRFGKKEQNKFIFLLCTRAGGLGINLTAADTVIIFDSDWNPQNDLQAQARCHRIGQTKMVKVYRLITAKTYEREMFDRASLKLGLDKAVLQSMAPKEQNAQLSKKEVEDLLKKGAYGAVMDEDNEGSKFNEEDIDTILQRRTHTITIEPGVKGSTFAKASFKSSTNEDIDVNDPHFWQKWADKAQVAVKEKDSELIVDEPRSRRRRFDDTVNNGEGSEAENGSDEDTGRRHTRDRSGQSELRSRSGKKRRRPDEDDDEYYGNTPDELTFNKSEYFKIEKMLLQWGWSRWSLIKEKLENSPEERDIEHMARSLLLHCLRQYKGDEKSRDYVWKLITPKGEEVIKVDKKNTNIYQQGWASNPEYNPPGFAIDHSFHRHVCRHTNKLIVRIHYLHMMQEEIITDKWIEKCSNPEISHKDIDFKLHALSDMPHSKWDSDCDKSLLIGIYRHGMENNEQIRADETLCFNEKLGEEFISGQEANNRFKKLMQNHMRQSEIALQNQAQLRLQIKNNLAARGDWTQQEEDDFIKILINYGVWDHSANDKINIKWTKFRERATSLSKKTDAQMMENLYCILARCSKVTKSPLGELDEFRAEITSKIPEKTCNMIMQRLTLMRKVHINQMTKDAENRRTHIRMLPLDNMPKGWTYEHDEKLFNVADTFGVNQLKKKLATLSEYKNIDLPDDKQLFHRLFEMVNTFDAGKYTPVDTITYDVEPDDNCEDELWLMALANAKQNPPMPSLVSEASTSSRRSQNKKKTSTVSTPTTTTSKKDINSVHQNFVKQMDQAALQQNYLLLQAATQMSGGSGSGSGRGANSHSNSNADVVAQIAQLQAILQLANPGISNANFNKAIEDALNLSKKDTPSSASSSKASSSSAAVSTTTASSSTPNSSQKASTNAATASSSMAGTSATTASSSGIPQLNAAEAAAFEKAAMEQLGIGFTELMILQSMDPNVTVCMHNPETKHTVTGDKAPTLKTLENWIRSHSKYKVDFNATLIALAHQKPVTSTPKATKTSIQNGVSTAASSTTSATNTSKPSTATTASSLSGLEPGEIPKASTSQAKTSTPSTSSATNEYDNTQIPVFSRTGATISKEKYPTLKGLQTYLDKNTDMNVAGTHANIVKNVLPKSYHNRIGGEAELFNQFAALMALNPSYLMSSLAGTSSASSFPLTSNTPTSGNSSNNNNAAANNAAQQALEAQMQLLIQQSMMQPYNYASMLGLSGLTGAGLTGANLSQFGGAATSTASSSTKPATSTSTKPSISLGTSSKAAAANAAAAASSSSTAMTANNNAASQLLSEAALTAEILSNPQLAQLLGMSTLSNTTASNQNQLNALYGMDQNMMNQIQALNMLSMFAVPGLTGITPSASTSGTPKASTEKKAATPSITASKKSLNKIAEDLAKTPASSS